MTKLIFRYSPIYDKNIAQWLKKPWSKENAKMGFEYVKKIQKRWDKINDKVFSAYESFGLFLPEWWLAYPITGWRETIPFSDPLTFYISEDWEKVFSIIIHELVHVELTFVDNEGIAGKVRAHVRKKFSKEDRAAQVHLPVNILQLAVMKEVFPKKYRRVLEPEKQYKTLKRAWEIIDQRINEIDLERPIDSILGL